MDWRTLVVNATISLFLSLITFSLGMRSGKERTDRLKIREKYREILVHFQKIYKGIVENDPKTWSDYENIQTKNGTRSMPLMRKMKENGEDVELNNSLTNYLNKLESESLDYGYFYSKLETNLEESFRDKLSQSGLNFIEEYGSWRSRKHEIGVSYSILRKRYGELLVDENNSYIIKHLRDNENLGLEMFIEKKDTGRGIVTTYIHPADLVKIDLEDIFKELKNLHSNDIDKHSPIKNELEKKLSKKIKTLISRTKEPYKFWETVLNTIKDFFR